VPVISKTAPFQKEASRIDKLEGIDPYLTQIKDKYSMMSLSAAIVSKDKTI
jgi:hypothetical protein